MRMPVSSKIHHLPSDQGSHDALGNPQEISHSLLIAVIIKTVISLISQNL
jgi:hypothetical protein